MESSREASEYLKELWHAFEKTGSISAYLLYNEMREKSGKSLKSKEKKAVQKERFQ